MKRFTIIATTLMMCFVSNAQQALWGGAKIVSPEIHNDNTVTFRILAPNANSVQVTGDFLPSQKIETPFGKADGPGTADLIKNENGVWEFTTPEPLSPELYSYAFILDGVRVNDPSNVYRNRDVATISDIFIIGGGRADLYKVNDVPHGNVSRVWYNSPTLGMNRRLTIYTPAGYKDSDRNYPVFYLLHGAGGDEEAWISLGRATQILDNLIAQGKAEPMIVVMTNGNSNQQAAPGEEPQGFTIPFMRLVLDGAFELAFPDVVDYVDKHYRTINEKSARAIAGLSMGGGHSLRISYHYPDMFDYVGLFSADVTTTSDIESPIFQDVEEKLATQFAKKPTLYWIAIGNADFLFDANAKYREQLDEKGYEYKYFETGEGHIWKNWRIYLSEFVPMLFK